MNSENGQTREILRARALALARPVESLAMPLAALEVVEFRLDQERYAIETQWVDELVPFRDLTPLPCVPPFVLGIVNVRGRILPVLDLKRFFDLPDQGITDLHRIILIQAGDLAFGVLADIVVGTRAIGRDEVQPPLPTLAGIRAEYIKGVTAERLVVLDIGRIVADPALIVHEEVKI